VAGSRVARLVLAQALRLLAEVFVLSLEQVQLDVLGQELFGLDQESALSALVEVAGEAQAEMLGEQTVGGLRSGGC